MREKMGDKARLQHILQAIEQVKNYTKDVDLQGFEKSSMMIYACIKQLEIIGEASNNLTEELINKFQEVSWKEIVGLRHILVHQYHEVNTKLIWNIISSDIAILESKVNEILATL